MKRENKDRPNTPGMSNLSWYSTCLKIGCRLFAAEVKPWK